MFLTQHFHALTRISSSFLFGFTLILAIICTFSTPAVTIGFIQTDYEVAENGGPVQFLIGVLEGILTIPVEVSFAIEDGTAVGKIILNILLLSVY